MNMSWIVGGAVLMLVSIFFTIFTLGLGIICTGPLFLIGLIIFIVGFIISEKGTTQEIHHYHTTTIPQAPGRFCPNCGRSIPFDAQLCPYCGRRF